LPKIHSEKIEQKWDGLLENGFLHYLYPTTILSFQFPPNTSREFPYPAMLSLRHCSTNFTPFSKFTQPFSSFFFAVAASGFCGEPVEPFGGCFYP